MSAAGLKQFLSDAGHRVAEGAGAGWYDVSSGFYTSFPFDQPIDADAVRQGAFLPVGAIGARFACNDGQGRPAWAIACAIKDYDLDKLSRNSRSKVRRGLVQFEVMPVSAELLAQQGHALNADTYARQGRSYGSAEHTYWSRYFSALARAEGAHVWGAVTGGELAAYCIAFVIGETSHLMILRSDSRFLGDYANNALVFGYLRHALSNEKLALVSFGLEPLGRELPQLVRFKESMGFSRTAIRQAVVLQPGLDRILRSPAGLLTDPVSRIFRGSEKFARLAALTAWVRKQDRLVFSGNPDGS